MRDREVSTDRFSPPSEDGKRIKDISNAIDQDDETKDFALLKRLKSEYPKLYEELIKRLETSLKSRKSENS